MEKQLIGFIEYINTVAYPMRYDFRTSKGYIECIDTSGEWGCPTYDQWIELFREYLSGQTNKHELEVARKDERDTIIAFLKMRDVVK